MTLTLADVSYRYAGGQGLSLNDITMTLEPGEVLGVVGANESGKSTLCLVAAGLAPGTIQGHLDGHVTIDDLDTQSAHPHELAQRCGILFQNPDTQLSGTARSVWEEIGFGPRNLGLPLDEIVDRVDEAMGALGISELAPRDPTRLSGGQAQLVALASVLAMRPAYLLLDEPTSQLDPRGTRLVGDALEGLVARRGAGILIVEHKTDVLDRLCWRVALLHEGRLVRVGPTAEMLAAPELEEVGVEPPSRVRLSRAAEAAGLKLPAEALAP
jgi:energy-coupling factor transport system ATP-binding protein